MQTYTTPRLTNISDTFRADVAAGELTTWCEENSVGAWFIHAVDHVEFEFPTDAKQFMMKFWELDS